MLTTAQIDGWFEDPKDPERYMTYYLCMACTEWSLFNLTTEQAIACRHCKGHRLNPQSATSKRSFDVARAKKQSLLARKGKK